MSLNGSSLRKLCFKVLLNEEENSPRSLPLPVKSISSQPRALLGRKREKAKYICRELQLAEGTGCFDSTESWSPLLPRTIQPGQEKHRDGRPLSAPSAFISALIQEQMYETGSLRALTAIPKMSRTLQEEYEILIKPGAFANEFLCVGPGPCGHTCEPRSH